MFRSVRRLPFRAAAWCWYQFILELALLRYNRDEELTDDRWLEDAKWALASDDEVNPVSSYPQ